MVTIPPRLRNSIIPAIHGMNFFITPGSPRFIIKPTAKAPSEIMQNALTYIEEKNQTILPKTNSKPSGCSPLSWEKTKEGLKTKKKIKIMTLTLPFFIFIFK
jgi:hypothetical protein